MASFVLPMERRQRATDHFAIWICAGSVEPPTGLSTVEAWWSSQASDYFTRPDLPERFTE